MNASSKKKLAQYERLAGMLRDRIASGTYAREDKLPSEMELMDESGLSRSTVRHALKVLVDEGLVRTERGRGAFVADTPALLSGRYFSLMMHRRKNVLSMLSIIRSASLRMDHISKWIVLARRVALGYHSSTINCRSARQP